MTRNKLTAAAMDFDPVAFDPFIDYFGLSGLLAKHGDRKNVRPMNGVTDCINWRNINDLLMENGADDRGNPVLMGNEIIAANRGLSGSPLNEDIHEMVQLMREMQTQWREMVAVQQRVQGTNGSSAFSHARSFYCAFCRQNGEMRRFYTSHSLKDRFGKVACPVLRAYVCPLCRATGDEAHTMKYCPLGDGAETVPLAKALRSGRNCSGQKRYSQQNHM